MEKAGGYISQIKFNNGESVDIKGDDIVVFVGPNNVGKSQALNDIYKLSSELVHGTIINDLTIVKFKKPIGEMLSELTSATRSDSTYQYYSVRGDEYTIYSNTDSDFHHSIKRFGPYYKLFVNNLDTENRLRICRPPESVNRKAPWVHPIHYAAFESKYRKWLASKFMEAFGTTLIPYKAFGASIPLCIGKPVVIPDKYKDCDEATKHDIYEEILSSYPQVHEQGDGIKSFTGILLNLMLDYYCTFLIDEPESFLHPPQAYIMGEIIGQTLTNKQQAFISTHSEEIIKGLLEACPKRVKIIRITRSNDTNDFIKMSQFVKVTQIVRCIRLLQSI